MEGNTFELKGMSLTNKGTPTSSLKPIMSPWNKVLEAHQSKTRQARGHVMKRRKVVMKSRLRRVIRVPRREGGLDRGIETRVRTLKSLIPNPEPEDLEGLFRVTADYILGLQMRVRVMQMMVDTLTINGSHE